jgi:hypothetical protein
MTSPSRLTSRQSSPATGAAPTPRGPLYPADAAAADAANTTDTADIADAPHPRPSGAAVLAAVLAGDRRSFSIEQPHSSDADSFQVFGRT